MRVGQCGRLLLGVAVLTAAAACRPAPAPVTVTVVSEPAEASVRVGSETLGQTPLTFQPRMHGTLVVHVEKDGYKTATELVDVPRDGQIQLEVTLVRRMGYVTLTSEPSAAAVYLEDGTPAGQTPINSYPVPIGAHTFTLHKENYEPASQEVNVQEDYRYSYRLDLKPKTATLTVFSRPTGARVWVNGFEQPKTTPAKFDLHPGAYTVALQAPGYLLYEEPITLGPAETKSVDAQLKEGAAPPGMVLIPEGEFVFGLNGASPDERPQQTLKLNAFYIDRTEVTNSQYKAAFPSYRFEEDQGDLPVTNITYKDAAAYAAAVGKRLPTEQEWEKAARGTDGRLYPWGDAWATENANSGDERGALLRRVGAYPKGASIYGCLDMAGNAYEWTSSWYEAYPGNTGILTEYGQVFKVLRGGSFRTEHLDVRCPARFYERLDVARDDFGFRCAMDVPAPAAQ